MQIDHWHSVSDTLQVRSYGTTIANHYSVAKLQTDETPVICLPE